MSTQADTERFHAFKEQTMNSEFVPVKPVERGSSSGMQTERPVEDLRLGNGQYFSFAMPPDWHVGEDGQFALTLVAPDEKAITVMVGNSGLPLSYPPRQFVHDKLMALQPQNLQIGMPRQAAPVAGFGQAQEFDVSYSVRGIASRGVAKVSIAPAYDSAIMAMTAALAAADQWPGYSTWLPQVADLISATNGGAFGMRAIMQQNLRNSTAFAKAAGDYRIWSGKNWESVTKDRHQSQDRQSSAVRRTLGGVEVWANPFGTSQPVELPLTYNYYWADRHGEVKGTNDPSANPNVGSAEEWMRMERVDGS